MSNILETLEFKNPKSIAADPIDRARDTLVENLQAQLALSKGEELANPPKRKWFKEQDGAGYVEVRVSNARIEWNKDSDGKPIYFTRVEKAKQIPELISKLLKAAEGKLFDDKIAFILEARKNLSS